MRAGPWIAIACSACAAGPSSSASKPEPASDVARLFTAPAPDPQLRPPDTPVAPSADFGRCMRGRMCELEGLCSPVGGQCIAQSDDDCRPSDACLGGRCTARDGVCVAASDQDCRDSWACKGWGRCHHDGDEACIATSEADCAASTRCHREGECSLSAGACVKAR